MFFLAFILFIAGCVPPGPRALLKGKKLLDNGDYAAAVGQFKTATSILSTNAEAWNYLGVACQRAAQPAEAVVAYQRAITLDRDLVEAHFNLGSFWLEQNKPAEAKAELTAYTLRRSNDPEGWLKLGSAQLHLNDFLAAEKSFSTALYLSTNNPEALNGLGLARMERGRPREASQFFAAAIKKEPDYAPALLNLATVADEELHDPKLALENYRAYLALTPHPTDWDAVNALVNRLETSTTAAAKTPSVVPPAKPSVTTAEPAASEPKPSIVHAVSEPKPSVVRAAPEPKPHPVEVPRKNVPLLPPRQLSSQPPEVVRVQPEPAIVAASDKPSPANSSETSVPATTPAANPASVSTGPQPSYVENGVTPLPPSGSTPHMAAAKPVQKVQPAAPTFPRYLYLSPRKPAAGDRAQATGAFTQAQHFEQGSQWREAMQAYRQAAVLDPAWFEAQYNFGVLAYRLRDYSAALPAYEMALAIRPDSTDARYNFALALKSAGYPLDAVNELKKVIAASPDEVRAQLELGNLYSQQLHDTARARVCYVKVLELDPHNSQANDIRYWLTANPG